MKTLILLLPLLAMNCKIFAQSYLLEPSKNAYFFNGLIGQQGGALHTFGTIGYSINGRFDMSLSGAHQNETKFASFNAISPSLSYLFIKQNKIPFSLGVFVEYEYKTFPEIKILKHNTFKFGVPLYHKFKINKNVSIIPGVYGKINLARYSMYAYRENYRSYTLGAQNTVLLKKFSITPGLSFNQRTRYLFSLQLGILLFAPDPIRSIY